MTAAITPVDRYRVNDALTALSNEFGVVFSDLGHHGGNGRLQDDAEEELNELTHVTADFLDRWRDPRAARLRRLRERMLDLAGLHRFAAEQGLHVGTARAPIRQLDRQAHLDRAAQLDQRVLELDLAFADAAGQDLVSPSAPAKSHDTLTNRVYDALIGAGKRALADEFVEQWEAARTGAPGNVLELETEYSPGHIRDDGYVFAQCGVIAPGYVDEYRREGGEVLARLVGAYHQVTETIDEETEER